MHKLLKPGMTCRFELKLTRKERKITMTIEESVKNNPEKFQAILDNTTPAIKAAMNELSAKLDIIFGGAIREYCEKEHVESDIAAIPTYKTVNKLITGKIDELIREHTRDKRKDIE